MSKLRTTAIASIASALVLAPSAAAKITWTGHGRGWGHGVGMSAYGAYGYGKHGFGYAAILRHYYSGTELSKAAAGRRVRVLIDIAPGDVSFTRATSACGRKLSRSAVYR